MKQINMAKRKVRVIFEVSRIITVNHDEWEDSDDALLEDAADEIAREVEEEVENGNIADLCFMSPISKKKRKKAHKK